MSGNKSILHRMENGLDCQSALRFGRLDRVDGAMIMQHWRECLHRPVNVGSANTDNECRSRYSPYAYPVEPFRPDRYHFVCHSAMIRPVHRSLASIVACKREMEKKNGQTVPTRMANVSETCIISVGALQIAMCSVWSASITNLCLYLFVDGVDLKLIVVVVASFEHFVVVVIVALYYKD